MTFSDTTIKALVLVALVLSVAGMLEFFPNSSLSKLVGFVAINTAEVKINLTQSLTLNVTYNVIDFGNGSITGTTCTMFTDNNVGDPNNCFTPSFGIDGGTDGLHIVNDGNVKLNVTVQSIKFNATDFFFTGTTTAGNEKYGIKCSGNGTIIQSTYVQLRSNTTTPTAIPCVSNLNATAGFDGFRVDVNITIPDSAVGFKNDTLTFLGTAG